MCRKGASWNVPRRFSALTAPLSGRAVQISRDHKSDSLDEKKRIQALHGYITENSRVNGVLALSRALGDVEQQPHVTYRPDVLEMDVSDAIEYVIMACDGLWDVMSNDEVVEHVKSCSSAAVRALAVHGSSTHTPFTC